MLLISFVNTTSICPTPEIPDRPLSVAYSGHEKRERERHLISREGIESEKRYCDGGDPFLKDSMGKEGRSGLTDAKLLKKLQ
jgi:hypothetical protein